MKPHELLVIFVVMLALYFAAVASAVSALRERDEERIEKEVERRVAYILSHAEIRVKQKLYIVDDTKKGGCADDL